MFFPKRMLKCKITINKEQLSKTIHLIGKSALLHIDNSNRSLFFANLQNKTHRLIETTQKYLDILDISQRETYHDTFEDFESVIEDIEQSLKSPGILLEQLSNEKDHIEKSTKKIELASLVNKSFSEIEISNIIDLKQIKVTVTLIPNELTDSLMLSFEHHNIFTVNGKFTQSSDSCAIFYHSSQEDIVKSILTKMEAQIIELKYFSKQFHLETAQKEVELQNKFTKAYEDYKQLLLHIDSKLIYIYKILSIKSSLIHQDDHFILYGWIPKNTKSYFEQKISTAKTEFFEVTKEAPVMLDTPNLFKPFEELIENFSYPSYNEMNPTILFAFTFLLMFGMMFGDIGHGAVLCIAGYFILQNKKKLKILGKILISTGMSAILFGILYGSFFGFHNLIPHLLFSPMENINSILYFSLTIGIAIISLSMVLNIFSKIRSKEYENLFFGSSGLLWLLLYWFFIGIMVKTFLFDMSVQYELYIALFILLIIFIMFLYKNKNFIKTILETSMEVMEYATNTVSFIRLGAFTLSHAALFLALFSITDIITKNQNEGIAYWLSIIIGNVIIVVLEGIVVTIQTLRLEYYEFFKRFYHGGGTKYQPFNLEKNNENINEI